MSIKHPRNPPREINFVSTQKDGETFVFFFDDEHRSETLSVLGQFAANPELNFDWYDAAVLAKRIRGEVKA